MKEIKDLIVPENLSYTDAHEWMDKDATPSRMGITDYAQDQLGDVVFVELPEPGTRLEKGEVCATVESVKAVSEIYMPVSGTVTGVNTELEDRPELVNSSPYGDGWILEISADDPAALSVLMDHRAYLDMLKGL
ncbi:glycine cleavage system protein GcvH [Desulfobotulus mexicanus]|uniref:Glycine cleavage system H protein n=1 Tax=Desulfobotulus mexicanus TaxID=2586642 RepID=A0A5Q4VHA9_9BACT|nr:glycine cleavage system protein GcvH [Desulfobotulus mexicanus]TYT75560.1 glycine cleavage system protein GcvH [Desulfobotulus mexicanus]